MQVFVDDQPYVSPSQSEQTVAQLANEACKNCPSGDERMVVGIRCNGEQITNENLDQVLASPADQYESIELLTQPIAMLVKSTLCQTIELFEQATENRRQTADLMSEGRHGEAMNRLQGFLDAWRQVQDSMLMCAQVLRVDLESLEIDLTAVLGMIKNQLNDLKTAMEAGDYVVVADILRYELDEASGRWLALLNRLCEKADERIT